MESNQNINDTYREIILRMNALEELKVAVQDFKREVDNLQDVCNSLHAQIMST